MTDRTDSERDIEQKVDRLYATVAAENASEAARRTRLAFDRLGEDEKDQQLSEDRLVEGGFTEAQAKALGTWQVYTQLNEAKRRLDPIRCGCGRKHSKSAPTGEGWSDWYKALQRKHAAEEDAEDAEEDREEVRETIKRAKDAAKASAVSQQPTRSPWSALLPMAPVLTGLGLSVAAKVVRAIQGPLPPPTWREKLRDVIEIALR